MAKLWSWCFVYIDFWEHFEESFVAVRSDEFAGLAWEVFVELNKVRDLVRASLRYPLVGEQTEDDFVFVDRKNLLRCVGGHGEGDLKSFRSSFARCFYSVCLLVAHDLLSDADNSDTTEQEACRVVIRTVGDRSDTKCAGVSQRNDEILLDDDVDEVTWAQKACNCPVRLDVDRKCDLVRLDEIGKGCLDRLGIVEHALDQNLVCWQITNRYATLNL